MKKLALLLIVIFIMAGCTTNEVEPALKPEVTSETPVVIETIVIEEETEDVPVKAGYGQYGVWYEIFVRAFADGDGDGIGDFKGLTEAVDYLNDGEEGGNDLGINGVWLMPINPSPSYHGYDVTDYYGINPDYGTMEDFESFIEAAHANGIQVIIDLVVNHSSSQHPWFIEAVSDTESPYRDFYSFIEGNEEGYDLEQVVWGHKVWNQVGDSYYYGIFWDQMPDLKFDTSEVRSEVKNIAKFWLEKGVDGFRMDAALHIYGYGEKQKGFSQTPANIEWWLEFDAFCREVNPDYYLVGEVWDNINKRGKYSEAFDTTFNFDMAQDNILRMVQSGSDLDRNNGFVEKLTLSYKEVSKRNEGFIEGPFLTNHDQNRAMGYFDNVEQMSLAANIYMTIPGNPFMYYGEEIGMVGSGPHEVIREPFVWGNSDWQTSWEPIEANIETMPVEVQNRLPGSLLEHYRGIIALRQTNEALLKGDFQAIHTTSRKVIAYDRHSENQTLTVVHNLSKAAVEFDLAEIGRELEDIVYMSGGRQVEVSGVLELPALCTVIFE